MQKEAKFVPADGMTTAQSAYSVLRGLRISTFQIGSAMGEILTASVWNRVMISDLGMPATPVGLLLALQYILLPISLWVGHRSDSIKFLGRRRDSYIWFGRTLMLIAFPLLGLSVQRFEAGDSGTGWLLATLCFLLFGGGKLASGSVFLALVRESAPPEKRGIAISLVETMLITMFPIAAIGFGRWMERYDEAVFWQMIIGTAVVAAIFWCFSIFRVEDSIAESQIVRRMGRFNFRETFSLIWSQPATRSFFIFLGLSKFTAWMQDNILEPFGGDVFALPAGVTTRFTGYWAGATVVVLLTCFALLRKQLPEDQSRLTSVGLMVMTLGMLMLGAASMSEQASLLNPSLLVFGGGFGLYTFGALSLMAVMSPSKNAGAYLGLWTACILFMKGVGTFAGGALRDLFILVGGLSSSVGYGLIFVIAGAGLFVSALLVLRIDFPAFARQNEA